MKPDEWPRLFITGAILGAFLIALAWHYSIGLEETLKNITMLAVGYWLGSSKGSSDKDKALMSDAPAPAPQNAIDAADKVAGAATDAAADIAQAQPKEPEA